MTVGLPLDLDDALKAFDEEGEKILRTLTAELDGNRPPPTIYHYTDDKGLRGILEFGTLWFTDIFNLNDPSELRHGLRHAVDMLNARAAGGLPETTTFASMFAALLYQGGLR